MNAPGYSLAALRDGTGFARGARFVDAWAAQVRSAYVNLRGEVRVTRDRSEHDVLAMHFSGGKIQYDPEVENVRRK